MKIITIYNSKGGVGKTTEAVHIAFGLASAKPKARVLLIDLDGQNSLKTYMRLKLERLDSYEFIVNSVPIEQCIYPSCITIDGRTCAVDLMPASAKMAAFDSKTANTPGRENLLKVRFDETNISKLYDYIIIDCPPSFSQNTINALSASHFVVIPAIMDDYAATSIDYLAENISILKRNLRISNPEILGVLPTQYDPRQSVSSSIYNSLPGRYPNLRIFKPIRLSSSYKKAQVQRSVVYASEKSPYKATEDNLAFIRELLSLIESKDHSRTQLEASL